MSTTTDSLSIQQARKLVLHSQRVLSTRKTGRAVDATLDAIRHLGYIQIDTISVVQRAHHHTLWNRNPRYSLSHIEKLLQQGLVFEYWSHAAAYLPMTDFRFSLPNKDEITRGRKRWYECDPKVKRYVLKRICDEGPLQAKDFERKEKGRLRMWEWKPAKYALEQLFMEGKLMVARRQGFQKVYDLSSRVLPEHVNTTMPTSQELCRFLIRRYLEANGPGLAGEIAYLRKGVKGKIETELRNMNEEGELILVDIQNEPYYVLPHMLESLSQPLSRGRLKILSPFDNLVIQRKRISRIFGFDYQIECYVPEPKRIHGYFSLPVLWNAGLAARMDCKADRKTNTFLIRNLVLEPGLKKPEDFTDALEKALQSFMAFNQCEHLVVGAVSNQMVKQSLVSRFK